MGFFDLPDPGADEVEPDDDYDEPYSAPWVGGVVALDLLVARSDQAAVIVTRIGVFPGGFSLTVESYLRRSVQRRRSFHPMWDEPGSSRSVPDEMLRFGLLWPDGGRATNLELLTPWPDATEPQHGLEPQGGEGDEDRYSQTYWAWPVPADGDLTVVVEWPAFAIPETRATIAAALFDDAVSRAHPVWPEDAGAPSHPHVAFLRGRIGSGGFRDVGP